MRFESIFELFDDIMLSFDEKDDYGVVLGTLLFYKNKQKINNLINAIKFDWKLVRAWLQSPVAFLPKEPQEDDHNLNSSTYLWYKIKLSIIKYRKIMELCLFS